MRFKAINEDDSAGLKPAGETQEAKEARIIKSYEQALLLIAQGQDSQSLVRLQDFNILNFEFSAFPIMHLVSRHLSKKLCSKYPQADATSITNDTQD